MKVLLGLVGVGTAATVERAGMACQQCTATFDTNDRELGTSDQGCLSGETDYSAACPNEGDVCRSMAIVDWNPRGDHLYVIKKGCGPKVEEPECFTYKGRAMLRDCIVSCDTADCNKDLDELWGLTSARENKVNSCNVCSFYQDAESGEVNGFQDCHDPVTGDGFKQECKPYADAGCFDAASYHKGAAGSEFEGQDFEDFYRGCTPFQLDEVETTWAECINHDLNGLDHFSCKKTCSGDNCNVEEHKLKPQCFSCYAQMDGAGRILSSTDRRCFDNLDERMLITCGVDEICFDELRITWKPDGHYRRSITRGCIAQSEVDTHWGDNSTCVDANSETGHDQYRECKKACGGSACNNDMSVGDLFSTNPTVPQKCQQCAYLEFDDGHREGLPSCLNSADPNRLVTCPSYADHGCYTATNSHIVSGENSTVVVQVERGCATFGVEDDVMAGLDCYDIDPRDNTTSDVGVCKDYCLANDCNAKQPVLPTSSGSRWPSCVTCQVIFDANDRVIGVGNGMDCRGDFNETDHQFEMTTEAKQKYAQRCPNKGDYCETEMEVDWVARGELKYTITRGCSATPAPERCSSGSSDVMQYRDCKTDCSPISDGNECNDDLEDVARRMNDGRVHVSECVTCSYTQDNDGIIEEGSRPECKEQSGDGLMSLSQKCPSYARVACATATSFHEAYGTGTETEEDFRHCSPFNTYPETNCVFKNMNLLEHVNCKNTCEEDNCNTETIQRGNQCHACTAAIDAHGRVVGLGNQNCFNDVAATPLEDCRADEPHCVTEMSAEWEPKGTTMYRITRGCGNYTAKPDKCQESENLFVKAKYCHQSCNNTDGPCNDGANDSDDSGIFGQISPNKNIEKCNGCLWEEADTGSVNGNKLCDGNQTQFETECPRYAREACFTGAALHFDFAKEFRQIYKGCSTFSLKTDPVEGTRTEYSQITLPDDSGNPSQYSTSKTTCGSNNCNVEHAEPEKPEQQRGTLCQVCSVVMDQFNRTIGVGNSDCWDGGNPAYQKQCTTGQYCRTEMEIDWLPRGQHQFHVIRGCTSDPPSVDKPCVEGNTRNGKYKDCKVSCDPRIEGNSCNKDLTRVAQKFSTNVYMDECYACEYYSDISGSITGNSKCPEFQLNQPGSQGVMKCPSYAHVACYDASSTHADYTQEDAPTFEDHFRGCSPFDSHNGDWWGKHCERAELNGFEHENCKELCFGPKCNFMHRDPKPQCHTCSVTLDSEGKTVGTSDPNCFADLTNSTANVVECSPNEPYCTDIMEITWYSRGMQYVHFQRGCTREPQQQTCHTFDNLEYAHHRTKFCVGDSCDSRENGPCNKDLSIIEGFKDLSGGVKNCTSCSYGNIEGEQFGNKNCPENADKSLSRVCPEYQSSSCYVASAAKTEGSGMETYKGCSYFKLDSVERKEDFIGDTTFKTVKETCTGDNCNEKKWNKP